MNLVYYFESNFHSIVLAFLGCIASWCHCSIETEEYEFMCKPSERPALGFSTAASSAGEGRFAHQLDFSKRPMLIQRPAYFLAWPTFRAELLKGQRKHLIVFNVIIEKIHHIVFEQLTLRTNILVWSILSLTFQRKIYIFARKFNLLKLSLRFNPFWIFWHKNVFKKNIYSTIRKYNSFL